jgi:hypothetical protein
MGEQLMVSWREPASPIKARLHAMVTRPITAKERMAARRRMAFELRRKKTASWIARVRARWLSKTNHSHQISQL